MPQTGCGPLVEEQARRIGDAHDPALVQLEAADFVGRAEPVLHAAHHAQRRLPVALEVQHGVHQVFQRARACDGAVLGDVTDEDDRHPAALRRRGQGRGDGAHLRDAAGHAIGVGGRHGLHGVHHHQGGLDRVDVRQHVVEVGIGGHVYLVVAAPGALGAHPDLAGRLLTRHVQRAAAGAGPLVHDLQQKCRLADPGLARQQRHRTGHHPAAKHPVKLVDTGGMWRVASGAIELIGTAGEMGTPDR